MQTCGVAEEPIQGPEPFCRQADSYRIIPVCHSKVYKDSSLEIYSNRIVGKSDRKVVKWMRELIVTLTIWMALVHFQRRDSLPSALPLPRDRIFSSRALIFLCSRAYRANSSTADMLASSFFSCRNSSRRSNSSRVILNSNTSPCSRRIMKYRMNPHL